MDHEVTRPEVGEEHTLALFPLNLVLYPGMVLPLHIFEDRYRQMMAKCIEEKTPFGVVLIREGTEVGEPATPEAVGTTARILENEQLPDGRMHILTRGDQRFEIIEITQSTPYMEARVRLLPEDVGATTPETVAEIQGHFAMCLRDLERLGHASASDVLEENEPIALSYSIASKLSASIKLPALMRQHWLTRDDAAARLDALLIALQGLSEALAGELEKRPTDIGLN